MDRSVVKDIMIASGLTVDAVCEALNEKLGWGVDKIKPWFMTKIYEPKASKSGTSFTKITKAQWDTVFDVINAPESARSEVRAMVKELNGKDFSSAEEVASAYDVAYENRAQLAAELAAKEAELAAEKAKRVAAKVENVENKSTEEQIEDLMKELSSIEGESESLL